MADNYLITGYGGEPHVTAENDRGIHAAIFGSGRFVLPVGEQFNAEYIGNNTIRLYDGKLMDNGAAAGIPAGEYVDLTITNASQGMNRNDLIVFEYAQNTSTLVETGVFKVIQGTETSGTPSDPQLTQNDLLSGTATSDQMPLWRVTVSSTAISAPVQLFSVVDNAAEVQSTLNSHTSNKSNPHNVTLAQIGADAAGSAAAVQTNLNNHTSNKSNPHGVTAAQVGAVNKSGDTMTGQLNATRFRVWDDNTPMFVFGNSSGTPFGEMSIDTNKNNQLRVGFRSSAGANILNYYYFPIVPSGQTYDGYYDILTTKSAVTIAQGGTGANDLAHAQYNMMASKALSTPQSVLTLPVGYYHIDGDAYAADWDLPTYMWSPTIRVWGRQYSYGNVNGYYTVEVIDCNGNVWTNTQTYNVWRGWSQVVNTISTKINNTSSGTIAGVQSFNVGSVNICMGITDEISVPANGYVDTEISFPMAFGTFPRVMVCDYYNNTTVSNIMNVHSVIATISASGMTIRTANSGSSARTVRAAWQAIGPA